MFSIHEGMLKVQVNSHFEEIEVDRLTRILNIISQLSGGTADVTNLHTSPNLAYLAHEETIKAELFKRHDLHQLDHEESRLITLILFAVSEEFAELNDEEISRREEIFNQGSTSALTDGEIDAYNLWFQVIKPALKTP